MAPTATVALAGRAELVEGPFAGAEVHVARVDNHQVLATGRTDEQGAFRIALPPNFKADTLLQITVRRGTTALVGMAAPDATPAAARRLLDYQSITVDLASTLAFVSLARAFDVLDQAETAGTTLPPAQQAEIARTFQALVVASTAAIARSNSAAVQNELKVAVAADGTVTVPAQTARSLTHNDPAFAAAFSAASQAIADAILTIAPQAPLGEAGGLTFGEAADAFLAHVVPVGGSGGGGSDGATAPAPGPEPSLRGIVRVGGVERSGALVQLRGPAGLALQAKSGADGSYAFYFLPPGAYTLVFAVDGAVSETRTVTLD